MPKLKKIYVTKLDHERLATSLSRIPPTSNDFNQVKGLREELDRATIVEPSEIPKNVVTMNSHIDVENMESDTTMTMQLVYPEDADINENKISIFSPVGTAILGYKIGDTIDWPVPSGTKKFKIKAIHYQPEAAGDYHL